MKKRLSILVAFLMVFTSMLGATGKSFANNTKLDLTAKYAVLMDYETGEVLYGKNRNEKLYPASTTKVWTAHVVLKHVPDLSQVIEIKDLPPIDGSSMYLRNGESFTVRDLLNALLVHSSNDAAYVLATYVSGSKSEFVKLMNEEAKAIGAKNTHFNNPHGLPDKEHYTTAYDMALMAREAMSDEVFRNIVKTKTLTFEATEAYPYARIFKNTNKFLSSNEKIKYKGEEINIQYDIVDGIKTGYTDDAGRCLLSSGVKNNMRLISAVFKTNGNNLYLDSRTLLDYGFENYYTTTIVEKEKFTNSKKVLLSKQGELVYEPEYSYKTILPNGTKPKDYTTNIKLDKIDLPIHKGDKVGVLEVSNGDKLEHTINLVAKDNVNSIFGIITENKAIMSAVKLALAGLGALVIFILLIILRKKSKKRKKYNSSIYSNKTKHPKKRRR
ncbi:D-alanyl-D-alanine carboxypeptidase family protein [Romboutsia lituseburensis]|uniref:D-alanyl-D-alanine carboxypeptidase family protein n=1 Tax=Romboutsia lituseburensis TaxID=1537 RepID=UPI00215AB3DE|nr:D-alanyl-D-alanine carboxypeptidase [Romboutsia lituseburensis]MCR8746535.1 D-alanyl-D-alanine carboxypeptidase [Romboutsia lituseburensis]